jgi:hypothetical protein
MVGTLTSCRKKKYKIAIADAADAVNPPARPEYQALSHTAIIKRIKMSGSRYGRNSHVARTATAVNARAKTLLLRGDRGNESTVLAEYYSLFVEVRPLVIISTETVPQPDASSSGDESTTIARDVRE